MVSKRVFLALPVEPVEPAAEIMILFESKLSPAGPTYIPLEVFPLIS